MDFATEQKLCQLAHEVWRLAAAAPCEDAACMSRGRDEADGAAREVLAALDLHHAFPLDGPEGFVW